MTISIDKTSAPGTSYNQVSLFTSLLLAGSNLTKFFQFLEDLPKEEARFAVTHIDYETEGGGQRTKLVFLCWIPRDSTTRTKMLHASTLAPFKQALNGIAISVQGHDMSDVQYDDVSIEVIVS